MWRIDYKVYIVVVDSTPVIFVWNSVDGSTLDSAMSHIVIESDYSIYLSDKWYLQVFDTAVVLPDTLDNLRKNKILIQGYQVSKSFISLLSWK